MANHYHSDGKHLDFVAAGGEVSGNLTEVGGQAGIIDPTPDSQPAVAGQLLSATIRGTVKIDNSGLVFADGATVGYDATNNNAVTGAAGDFDCGTCVGGAGTGEQVIVLLNGH